MNKNVVAMASEQTITPPYPLNEEQVQLIKNTICRGSTDDELRLFLYQCKRTGLDPLTRQIYAIQRWDKQTGKYRMVIQTSIDGFRLVAQRTSEYQGQTQPEWCGQDGVWKDVWLKSDPPAAARIGVFRENFQAPVYAVARFDSYAVHGKDGQLNDFWRRMPDVMIAKVAESLALRKAFPQELSGLYTSEEMQQADDTSIQDRQTERETKASKVGEDQRQAGEDIIHALTLRIQNCSKHADLIEIGKEITPDLTKKLQPQQVEQLRATYQEALKSLKQPKAAGNSVEE